MAMKVQIFWAPCSGKNSFTANGIMHTSRKIQIVQNWTNDVFEENIPS